ncbi:glyceraldehyde-3-phosphate dehydrogenase [Lasius niger]|uniref:Glyceraldehyde-3-phosphate dehydrogenase n=1 Tax=Lasius niger TaxID=67767 RepID=A0A0J7KGU9_LASNI|nr:glyceraldehyde-3-phosphate dehydrogenase [Lasius niger]
MRSGAPGLLLRVLSRFENPTEPRDDAIPRDWQEETNPSFAETLGVVITILATYTPYYALKDAGLETSLSRCHIKVGKTTWETLAVVEAETKEVQEAVAESMGFDDFDSAPQACTVVALSVLILIGKNVTEVNRDGWFRNRWKALAHVSSVSVDADRMEPPLLRPCQAIYSASSSNHPRRSCLFKVMRTLASIIEDQNHVIFDRIIRLLQWAEMSHIWMIMDYIYDQNPDILNFPELNGPEVASMMVAIEFLKKYSKEDRAYLKLLYDHNDLMPLHSNNFIYFTAAAHAIAAITKTSMLNINSRFSEGVKAFQGRVIDYISSRNKLGSLASAVSYGSTLPESVQNALVRSIKDAAVTQDIPDFADKQPEARE